jgi:hypothetical protein
MFPHPHSWNSFDRSHFSIFMWDFFQQASVSLDFENVPNLSFLLKDGLARYRILVSHLSSLNTSESFSITYCC